MYYIQHKYYTWLKWERWGTYPSKEKSEKAFDKLKVLVTIKPITMNGVDFHDIYKGYDYRLTEDHE